MDLNLRCPSTSLSGLGAPASPYCGCTSDVAILPSYCRYAADSLSRAASSASMSVSFQYLSYMSTRSHRITCTSWRGPRATLMESAVPAKQDFYTVGDFMTRTDELLVVKTSTTVDEALELLVQNRITGLPVVDDDGKLIGVVSDFDLLALDAISGTRSSESSLFPEAGSTWKAFKELQKLISKTQGKTVGDVMTPSPLVIRRMTNLEDAARLLLETKYRRLPVVDDNGQLIGLLTRGNVIRAALKMKRDAETNPEGV